MIDLIATFVSGAYSSVKNYLKSRERKANQSFDCASLIIDELNTPISGYYELNRALSISEKRLNDIFTEMSSRFVTLQRCLSRISEEHQIDILEFKRKGAAKKLEVFLKSLAAEQNEGMNYTLKPESLKGFAYLVRFIYGPDLKTALSQFIFSETEKEAAIEQLIGAANETKLTKDFVEPAFAYRWK